MSFYILSNYSRSYYLKLYQINKIIFEIIFDTYSKEKFEINKKLIYQIINH